MFSTQRNGTQAASFLPCGSTNRREWLLCYRSFWGVLCQLEISIASGASAPASLMTTGLALPTQPSGLHSPSTTGPEPAPTAALHSARNWSRHVATGFHLGYRCLDEGDLMVPKNSEWQTTAEFQEVLWLSPGEY